MPTIINIRILPSTIPKKLNKYNKKLCTVTNDDCITIPNPVTDNGGITATEIAIPVIVSGTFGLLYAYAPARPLRNATRKNNKLGSKRDAISALITGARPSRDELIIPTKAPVPMAKSTPNAVADNESTIRLVLKTIVESARSNIGVVSGATTIAPIIMLTLFNSNPNAARADDNPVKKKKFSEGLE